MRIEDDPHNPAMRNPRAPVAKDGPTVTAFRRTENADEPGVVYVEMTVRVQAKVDSVSLTVHLGDAVTITNHTENPL